MAQKALTLWHAYEEEHDDAHLQPYRCRRLHPGRPPAFRSLISFVIHESLERAVELRVLVHM